MQCADHPHCSSIATLMPRVSTVSISACVDGTAALAIFPATHSTLACGQAIFLRNSVLCF